RFISAEFLSTAPRELRDTAPRIIRMRQSVDETFVLQAAEQTAHEPRVEAEIVAQLCDIAAPEADRVEHARRAQRPATPEKRGVECTDFRCDGAVEAADAGDGVQHII